MAQTRLRVGRRDFLKGAICAAGGLLAPFSTGIFSRVAAAAPPGIRNFHMVGFGDSVMWGQGLPEAMKFRTLVKNWLTMRLQGQANVIELPTHSHSGAVTGFGRWPDGVRVNPDVYYQNNNRFPGYPYPGEVPFSYPSISYQMSLTLQDLKARGLTPGDVDLVLLDGGINDFGITNVLTTDPSVGLFDGSGWVKKETDNVTVAHMASLLPMALSSFPNAKIVITGYFPIVSPLSNIDLVVGLLTALGGPIGNIASAPLKTRLILQSKAFNDTALAGLTDLVSRTNRSLGTPRVGLAWPDFQPQNSYGAGDTYLFKVGQFTADEERGERRAPPPGNWATLEGIAYYRGENCASYSRSPKCYDASMGHPNPKGAWAYAYAITALLPGLGVIPHAATPPGPPRTMTVNVSSGSQGTGYWVNVTAADSVSHAPIHGNVSINGVTGTTGTRIVFAKCTQSVIEGVGGSKHKITQEVMCQGTVTAPGYSLAHFTAGGSANY